MPEKEKENLNFILCAKYSLTVMNCLPFSFVIFGGSGG